ncbi:hypothetical protein QNH00_gp07 [Yersinia phage PYps16N]|uniref:Uncharacterized protein n=1 Tax=Yersinia phage PYps16N TaxID=2801354 RepID=A0AAE7P3W1_9CAUD|nr:hypothetical protein QNH00_gp07 [Yersinia phage PYps16N]QQO91180.1 hypothetical protein ORF007 [Yersinia phage PYps16N]
MNDQQFNTLMQQINHQELMNAIEGKKPVERQYRKIDNYMPTIIACVGVALVLYFLVK